MPTLRDPRTVTVTAGDTQLVPANPRRKSVIIGTPKTATVWLNFAGPAVVGQGIALRPGQTPFRLSYSEVEDAVHEEIRAISDGVPEQIGVLDFFG